MKTFPPFGVQLSIPVRVSSVSCSMPGDFQEPRRFVVAAEVAPDVGSFLPSDGKISQPKPTPAKRIRVGDLFEDYSESIPDDAVAPELLRIAEIHIRHVVRIVGKNRDLRTLQSEDLQHYVVKRARERGKAVATGTIKKELSTFRTLFRWAKRNQYVTNDFPSEGLKLRSRGRVY